MKSLSRRLLASGLFRAGAATLLFWLLCATVGPSLLPWNPYRDDLYNTLSPPSLAHWFGTDALGRDIFARTITGARSILSIAPAATLLATLAGTFIGLLTGYLGGLVDALISRVIDMLLALPLIMAALLALTALGPSRITVIIVIGVVFTPLIARTVRAAVIGEAAQDYVAAAQVRGESTLHIMFVEILPNVLPPVIVEATVRLGYAIFTTASLSFLGFGIQPPSPDWGLTIADNYGLVAGGFWWPVAFAAAATASLVIGVQLMAEGLEAALE